jgi:hypothetical protein
MKKRKLIVIGILIVIYAVIIFMISPNLSPFYDEGLGFWSFVISSCTVVLWLTGSDVKSMTYGDAQPVKLSKKGRVYLLIAAAPWILLILLNIYSSGLSPRMFRPLTPPSFPLLTQASPRFWRTKSWENGPHWAARLRWESRRSKRSTKSWSGPCRFCIPDFLSGYPMPRVRRVIFWYLPPIRGM